MGCETGSKLNRASSEELSPLLIKASTLGKLYNIVGKPYDKTKAIKMSNISEGKKNVLIKKEASRFAAHKNFINFIADEVIKTSIKSAEPLKTVESMLSALITLGDKQFLGITDMNNTKYWDSGRIVSAKNFFRKIYETADKNKKISKSSDTVRSPHMTAALYDKTGKAVKIVQESMELLDELLHVTHGYNSQIEVLNARLINQVGSSKEVEAHKLIRDLMSSRTRYFVPLNRKTFNPDSVSKKIEKYSKNALNVIEIGDTAYVNFKLDQSELSKLNNMRSVKNQEVLSVNTEVYGIYTLDSKKENNISEGYWEADTFHEFKGVQFSDGTNKRAWYGFKKIESPPKSWMQQVLNEKSDQDKFYITIWDMVSEERKLFRDVHKKVSDQLGLQDERRAEIKTAFRKKFGVDFEKKIDGFGGDSSVAYKLGSTIYTGSSALGAVNNYDPNLYYLPTYWNELENELLNINLRISNLKDAINQCLIDINSEESNKEEKEEASSILVKSGKNLKELRQRATDFKKALNVSSGIESYEAAAEHNQTRRLVEQKHRSFFMDPTKRRVDKDVARDYIYSIFRGTLFNEIKITLMENMLDLNQDVAEFVADQVSVATGNAESRAGFLGIDYSNPNMAEKIGWFFKNTDIEITPEMIQKIGQFHNAYVIANNLGSNTALTNNFQRWTAVLDTSLKSYLEAMNIAKNGTDGITAEEWGGLIEETGVLDPLRAFTDALTAGMPTVSADFDFILPYADIYKLVKLSRAEFSKNDDKFDRMIENHLKRRSLKQQADIKAIKNIKEKIYDIVHSEVPSNPEEIARYKSQLKNLKLGLTEDYINRLVAWKLNWQFFGFSGLTMGGSERNMRSEVAIEGMLRAEEDGMIPEFDSRGQRLTGINRYRHPNAIRMARLYVYNTMFGMSSQFLPKMFRGAVGKFGLQFKSYQYHQLLHDWKYFQNFVASEEKTNPLFTAGNLSIRLTNELGRMLGGRKLGISSKSDITANRLLKFILSRGTASVLSVGMFYVPGVGFIIRKIAGKFGFRGVRGLESPVFTYPMRAIYLALILGMGGDPDDEEAKGALQSFLMDWTPPLMNTLVFLFIDGLKAARPYIPLYNPIGVTVGLGADLILDDY